jgi:predicted Fe-Mo cluster-binding NifX family protein
MRIAVASDDGVSIAGHFGRCAGFIIFDIENEIPRKLDYLANTFGHHSHGECDHQHEGGHHGHDAFADALQDCQVVLCRGMGRRAVMDLEARGIKAVITSQEIDAEGAVKLFVQGKLPATNDSACSH